MRAYKESLSRCMWMLLLVVIMLFSAVAMDPLKLNSLVGLTIPVSADDGAGWSGTWNYYTWGDVTVTQSGNQLTFVWANKGYGTLTGTVSGNKFTGTNRVAFDTSAPLSYWDLTLAPGGQLITGTMDVPNNAFNASKITMTRVGTGTGTGTTTATTTGTGWSGTWNYPIWGNVTITQSGNQLTLVWANTGYGTITGTVSGNKFTGIGSGANTIRDWELTLSPDGQLITGSASNPNSAFASAKVTMTRVGAGTGTGTTGTGTGTGTSTGTGTTTATGAALVSESRTAAPNSTVQVPIRLDRASGIGSMNFVLTYNAQVLKVNKVDGGSLVSGALFTPNFKTPPQVRFGLATSGGISGSGTVAYIEFQVIGAAGSSSPLSLSELDVTDTSGKSVTLTIQNGTVTVASGATGTAGGKVKGDYNGDGKVSELDALAALKMSVKLLPEDLTLDMDGNGKVTAEDARLILKQALGK